MKYHVVDAFAEKVFEGNPAGVCVMDKWLPDGIMQNIAAENNLSETAFAVKEQDFYRLRWFTPANEIDLCGHATLGTAFVIANYYQTDLQKINFETLSGRLTVEKKDDLYEMDFPSRMPENFKLTQQMIEALGCKPEETLLSRDLMFVLKSEEAVETLTPDFAKLLELSDGLGVIVTAKGKEYDFVSRFFCPKLQINEDPVTGSSHSTLIPYWAKQLKQNKLTARQLSKRGGTLYCEHTGERVKIAGKAVLYAKSELYI